MHFDWRLPRQEGPSQKCRQCYVFAPLPSREMKNPSALQHITVWSFQTCAVFNGGDEQGNCYEQTQTERYVFCCLYTLHV